MGEELILEKSNGVRIIKINRPKRKNAFSPYIYKTMKEILNRDANDDDIVVTIITGVGDYYSSGNDIKAAMTEVSDTKEAFTNVHDMVEAFINYPKILIAMVNGPAIGIAATTAALCDIVYATENAVFDTPFLKLGLCAEAASSFTYPLILGRSKASEVLLLNHKLSAKEAYDFGFVSKVIPQNELDQFISHLKKYGDLSVNSVKVNKKLITRNFSKVLSECNERECEQLLECSQSEEFAKAIMTFLNRKSKL